MHRTTLHSRELRLSASPEVLLYYDGPLLAWLPSEGEHLLAIALPDEVASWPFLVVSLSASQAEALMTNQLTLKAAVIQAAVCYLLPDYGAEVLELQQLESIPDGWYPGDVPLCRPD